MKEVTIRGNKTGLRILVNGEPNFSKVADEELTLLGTVFELVVSKQYQNYIKRKNRDPPKKTDI